METLRSLKNSHISAAFITPGDLVCITDASGKDPQYFAGFADLKEMYDLFEQTVSEETTYQDAINFFKPQFKITI